MKLRQASKILRRIDSAAHDHQYYGKPLPRSWRRYMSMWHRANAVCNHHCGPFGRMANRWLNSQSANIHEATQKAKELNNH